MLIHILHHTGGNRWLYDSVPDRAADEGQPCDHDGGVGGRMAVLYALCQSFLCDYKHIQAVCNVDDRICNYYGANTSIPESFRGMELWKNSASPS